MTLPTEDTGDGGAVSSQDPGKSSLKRELSVKNPALLERHSALRLAHNLRQANLSHVSPDISPLLQENSVGGNHDSKTSRGSDVIVAGSDVVIEGLVKAEVSSPIYTNWAQTSEYQRALSTSLVTSASLVVSWLTSIGLAHLGSKFCEMGVSLFSGISLLLVRCISFFLHKFS